MQIFMSLIYHMTRGFRCTTVSFRVYSDLLSYNLIVYFIRFPKLCFVHSWIKVHWHLTSCPCIGFFTIQRQWPSARKWVKHHQNYVNDEALITHYANTFLSCLLIANVRMKGLFVNGKFDVFSIFFFFFFDMQISSS